MINIVVDIGNSIIKVGKFEKNKLINQFKVSSLNEVFQIINTENPKNLLIASVKNYDISTFSHNINEHINLIILNNKTPLPIINNYQSKETLGVDRIAAVVGASYLFPEKNCLVVDIGTCITYDFISKEKVYLGGAISLGISMKFKALNNFTANLPLVNKIFPNLDVLIGKNTEESILSGVINGTSAEIEQMIHYFSKKTSKINIILCGGDSKYFESRIKAPIFAIPELVLIGLNRILEYNVL